MRDQHPVHTPVVAADGALLWFDLAELLTSSHVGMRVEVSDAAAAEPWLVRLAGIDHARTAIEDGQVEVDAPADLARLALLLWARRWWPTSSGRGVHPLDAGLLALEAAAATAAVEGIADGMLDGFEAAPAELFDAATGRGAAPLLAAAQPVVTDTRQLCEQLSSWFDGQDDVVRAEVSADVATRLAVPVPTRQSYALAAGARPAGLGEGVLVSGRGSVDWALVPPGVLDAAEDTVGWQVVTAADGTRLDVTVTGVLGEASLYAVVTYAAGDLATVPLVLVDNEFSGFAVLDDIAAGLAAAADAQARIGVHVAASGVRIQDIVSGTTRADRAAVIELVLSRASLPGSRRMLAERAAGEGFDEF